MAVIGCDNISRKIAKIPTQQAGCGLAPVFGIGETPTRRGILKAIFGRSIRSFCADSLGAEGRGFESLCPDQVLNSGRIDVAVKPAELRP